MKIAFILIEFPKLSETFILNQITGLIDKGHKVDIYTDLVGNFSKVHPDVIKYKLLNHTYYSDQVSNNKILRIIKRIFLFLFYFWKAPLVSLRSLNFIKYGKQAASLMLFHSAIPILKKQLSYDIIHCHFGPSGIKATILRDIGAIKGKLITTYHGLDLTMYTKFYGKNVYNHLFEEGDLFLPISKYMKNRLTELGCNKKKIYVHHMGINCDQFCYSPRNFKKNNQIQIVTIARFVEKKGLEYAIQAVSNIVRMNEILIKYIIIGNGPLYDKLKHLIQELEIGNIIQLLGWKNQDEIIEILNKSHIFLLPSVTSLDGDKEGIPVVLMEAMAMGIPVISTEHSGIPELIENGVTGFLVPERNLDLLTNKLNYVIKNPELWLKLGNKARSYVEKHFNINKLNDRLEEIYLTLLN